MANDNNALNDLVQSLEAATLAELRSKASKTFGLRISRNHTRDDIIAEIMEQAKKFEFAKDAEGDLEPGWSRIKVHPIPGRSKFPFYFNLNGYQGLIPLNREVDVPNKIVKMLRDAEENQPVTDDTGAVTWRLQESYPFTLIEQRKGPDPKPGIEVQREIKLQPKRDFYKEHGYWPSDAVLAEHRKELAMLGIGRRKVKETVEE